MKDNKHCRSGEEGFVLVAALLVLMVLTLMGVAVNRNTNIEWQIAMNDRMHKEAFYDADAASELASEILEQSIACLGFKGSTDGKTLLGYSADKDKDGKKDKKGEYYNTYIYPRALGFWRNYSQNGIKFSTDIPPTDWPSMTPKEQQELLPDIIYPAVITSGSFQEQHLNTEDVNDFRPHARIKIGGNTKLTAGAAIQMAAGYEGMGKGLGLGGAVLTYDITVLQMGQQGSISKIFVQYGHVLGSEGACNYP
jgi:hypothetical protein